jgi:hypothetical protein
MHQASVDFLEELDWFRQAGVSASLTIQTLGRSWVNVEALCRRAGRKDLALWVTQDHHKESWAAKCAA